LEERVPKVAQILEQVEAYILAFYTFPAAHCPKLRSSDEIVKHPTPAEAAGFRRWMGRVGASEGRG